MSETKGSQAGGTTPPVTNVSNIPSSSFAPKASGKTGGGSGGLIWGVVAVMALLGGGYYLIARNKADTETPVSVYQSDSELVTPSTLVETPAYPQELADGQYEEVTPEQMPETEVATEAQEVASEPGEVPTETPQVATDAESPVVNQGNTGP